MMMRLDMALVQRGLIQSRQRAKETIEQGQVLVQGKTVLKAATLILEDVEIEVLPQMQWVGRGAYKLLAALDGFSLSPKDLVALDVGASTGGFTQVLLVRGAKKVYAVDVGSGQLASCIAEDARVCSIENLNARDLQPRIFDQACQIAVADVSFISLRLLLRPIRSCLPQGGWLVALFKPQFECGKAALDKHGVVKSVEIRTKTLHEFCEYAQTQGFMVVEHIPSPILGKEGNAETLMHLVAI